MKQYLFTTTLALVLASSLVACGKKEAAQDSKAVEQSQQTQTATQPNPQNQTSVAVAESDINPNTNQGTASANNTQNDATKEAMAMADDVAVVVAQ